MARQDEKSEERAVCRNRRAWHDFHITQEVEAGISLVGTEVKSLRDGRASLAEAHARIKEGEVWLIGSHIPPYVNRGSADHDPTRPRKLLLHAREIHRLQGLVDRKGFTLVPLAIYFTVRGIAKVKLGVAKGKRAHDRREDMKRRDAQRQMDRARKGA